MFYQQTHTIVSINENFLEKKKKYLNENTEIPGRITSNRKRENIYKSKCILIYKTILLSCASLNIYIVKMLTITQKAGK